MVIFMFSCLRYYKDKKSFKHIKSLGFDVYEIEDLEKVDDKLKELKKDYSTVVISNDIANFSQDIITKYKTQKNFTIIIARKNSEKNVY